MIKFEEYSKKHTHFYNGELRPLIKKYISVQTIKCYLDVGCGDGALLYALKERDLLKGVNVLAVDLSEDRVYRASSIDCSFVCKVDTAETLSSVKNEIVDFLTIVNVIEHGDDIAISKAIFRVLSPGGYCYISTTFKKTWGWYFYRNGGKWVLDPTHVREYTSNKQLFNILSSVGFIIKEEKKTSVSFPIVELLLRRLGVSSKVFNSKILRKLRSFRILVPGYYKWEIICQKCQ